MPNNRAVYGVGLVYPIRIVNSLLRARTKLVKYIHQPYTLHLTPC